MEKMYISPLTEIVYLSTENILEGELTQDSEGTDDPWHVGANSGTFEDEEDTFSNRRSLWDN